MAKRFTRQPAATDPDVESVSSYDIATVDHFGQEWVRFDHKDQEDETIRLFEVYFEHFPFEALSPSHIGADIGCGSARWARQFARHSAAHLTCIDPSYPALQVARQNLVNEPNASTLSAAAGDLPFADAALDFAYCLGVLHHVPDPARALKDCARILKPGAPFLCYLYYALDNRPWWYRKLWLFSDLARRLIYRSPRAAKTLASDLIAVLVYFPLARLSALVGRFSETVASGLPLAFYRNTSLYWMRNCALDRFGTPIERRYTLDELFDMLSAAGFEIAAYNRRPPYWTILARRH
jgi:SAM-dependent methyltransferase